jgi:hypothetical protein
MSPILKAAVAAAHADNAEAVEKSMIPGGSRKAQARLKQRIASSKIKEAAMSAVNRAAEALEGATRRPMGGYQMTGALRNSADKNFRRGRVADYFGSRNLLGNTRRGARLGNYK